MDTSYYDLIERNKGSVAPGHVGALVFQGPLTSMGMSVHNPEQFYQLVGGYDGPVTRSNSRTVRSSLPMRIISGRRFVES